MDNNETMNGQTRKDEPVREPDWFAETRVWIDALGD